MLYQKNIKERGAFMKLTREKKVKATVCVLLVIVMCVGMFYMPNTLEEVKATGIATSINTTREVLNEDFESGRNGYRVKNWSKTAMEYSTIAKITNETTAASYCNAYTLEIAAEADGNKVASLRKNGSGYVAVTSEAVQVTAKEEYRITFDYKTVEVTTKAGATTGLDYFGVRLIVEEFDANGESLGMKRIFSDASNTNQWSTGIAEFTAQADTASIVIYLWMGGYWNMYATVHFDNVVLESMNNYKVVNGTFDKATYKADGGRADGEMGPAGWTGVSCNIGATSLTADNRKQIK